MGIKRPGTKQVNSIASESALKFMGMGKGGANRKGRGQQDQKSKKLNETI